MKMVLYTIGHYTSLAKVASVALIPTLLLLTMLLVAACGNGH